MASFFVPSGSRIPGTQNIRTLTITERADIATLVVNELTAPIITDGVATLHGGYLTGLHDPIVLSGAATKNYVDNIVGNLVWKEPCRLATVLMDNLSLTGLPVIDSVQTIADDRILVKNQINQVENGYYIASVGVWPRADDMQDGQNVAGYTTIILEGTDNADTSWLCTNNQFSDIVGTDQLHFTKFTGFDLAGAGLSQVGEMLNVNTDNTSIYINGSNNLSLVDTSVVAGSYGSSTLIPAITVDAKGRLTSAADTNIHLGSIWSYCSNWQY